MDQPAGGFDIGFHVSEFEADPLELPDLLTKSFPFSGVFHAGFVGGFGDPQSLGGNPDPPGIQHRHSDLEALAFFSQPVGGRDAAVFKQQLAGGGGADPQFGFFLAALEAGGIGIYQEGSHPAMPVLRLGGHEDNDIVGDRAAGDPGFESVEHILIPIPHSPAAHRAGIGAGHRLGQRVSADLLCRRPPERGIVAFVLRCQSAECRSSIASY